MRAADDVEAIYASIQELRKANAPKPRCPRHDGGSCLSPCSQMSDCHIEAQKRGTAAQPGADYC